MWIDIFHTLDLMGVFGIEKLRVIFGNYYGRLREAEIPIQSVCWRDWDWDWKRS